MGAWVMETGEGAAIAAGAEDIESINLDEVLAELPGKIAHVLTMFDENGERVSTEFSQE